MSYGKVNKSNGDRIPYATGAIDNSKIGDLDNLTTTNKSNLVSAINEVNSVVSTKQDKTDNNLTTSSKTIVGAINEINNAISSKQNSTDNNLTTSSKTIVGGINEVKSGLDNVMKVPDQDAVVLGYATKNGPNNVIVSLGSNNILNYDFLEFMTAYYNSGVACYGYLIVPTCTMRYIFGGDVGVAMTTRNTVNTVGAIHVVLNHANNDVTFIPQDGIEPLGNYYVVRGVKLRK